MRRGAYTSTFPSLSPVNTTEDIRPNRIHDGFLRKDATQNSECKRALFGAAGSIRLLEQRQCAPRVDASRDDRVERGDVQVPNVDAPVRRHTPEHRRHIRRPAPQSHRAACTIDAARDPHAARLRAANGWCCVGKAAVMLYYTHARARVGVSSAACALRSRCRESALTTVKTRPAGRRSRRLRMTLHVYHRCVCGFSGGRPADVGHVVLEASKSEYRLDVLVVP